MRFMTHELHMPLCLILLFVLSSPSLSFLHITLGVPESELLSLHSPPGHLFASQEEPISTFHVAVPLKIVIA